MGLEEALKSRGIKKKWLAEQLGVTPETIYRWCNGYPISDINKQKISELLGISVTDIFYDTNLVARNLKGTSNG